MIMGYMELSASYLGLLNMTDISRPWKTNKHHASSLQCKGCPCKFLHPDGRCVAPYVREKAGKKTSLLDITKELEKTPYRKACHWQFPLPKSPQITTVYKILQGLNFNRGSVSWVSSAKLLKEQKNRTPCIKDLLTEGPKAETNICRKYSVP